jgi:hypothetical protein
MNFARVNCDQRATQSVMRNIAFPLQARNQLKRIDRFVVRGYCRAAALKMFCVARAESTISRTRSTKSVGENRSAQNQFLDTAIDTSTLRHRCVVEAGRRSANPGLFVVASARGASAKQSVGRSGRAGATRRESKRTGSDLFAHRSRKT